MTDYREEKCSECGQLLRIPEKIGGILMVCPSCGNKIHSDFKLGSGSGCKVVQQGIAMRIFEMPYELLRRFSQFFKS